MLLGDGLHACPWHPELLSTRAQFSFVTYGKPPAAWSHSPRPATQQNKSAALAWLASQDPGGTTCFEAALALTFEIAQEGTGRKRVLLVTDGAPQCDEPAGESQMAEIVASVTQTNYLRIPITAFHVSNYDGTAEFLRELCVANQGSYYHVPGGGQGPPPNEFPGSGG